MFCFQWVISTWPLGGQTPLFTSFPSAQAAVEPAGPVVAPRSAPSAAPGLLGRTVPDVLREPQTKALPGVLQSTAQSPEASPKIQKPKVHVTEYIRSVLLVFAWHVFGGFLLSYPRAREFELTFCRWNSETFVFARLPDSRGESPMCTCLEEHGR